MNSLDMRAFGGLGIMLIVLAVLLFGPAWTLDYWQAWVFITLYLAAYLVVFLYLVRKDRMLLERRMRGGPTAEKETAQKIIMLIMSLAFVGLFVVPALDHRFAWSHVSVLTVAIGNFLVLLGWYGIFLVFQSNSFAASTIEVAPEQTVISTGPYAWVRHPMYTAGLLMFIGVPISLGSWWGLAAMIAIVPALIWRLLDEEAFLAKHLIGYTDYLRNVRYRLIPWLW